MFTSISKAAEIAAAYSKTFETLEWEEIYFHDGFQLNDKECIASGIVGSAVDYLSRMMITGDKNKAFKIPLWLTNIPFLANSSIGKSVDEIFEQITDLDSESIINACYLVCFDEYTRGRDIKCVVRKQVRLLNLRKAYPHEYLSAIGNIRMMVLRCIAYFKQHEPVIDTGFCVKYDSVFGDGDFLTETELCDIKTGRQKPSLTDKRQVLLYWYVGLHTEGLDFSKIDTLSIFNPRLNMAWKLKVSQLPEDLPVDLDMFCRGECFC